MDTIVHSGQRGLLPELFDLLESPMTADRPHGQVIRFEDYEAKASERRIAVGKKS
jgi:hypothetical protein